MAVILSYLLSYNRCRLSVAVLMLPVDFSTFCDWLKPMTDEWSIFYRPLYHAVFVSRQYRLIFITHDRHRILELLIYFFLIYLMTSFGFFLLQYDSKRNYLAQQRQKQVTNHSSAEHLVKVDWLFAANIDYFNRVNQPTKIVGYWVFWLSR